MGADAKSALNTIRKRHKRNIIEKDRYFSYHGSELGESTYVSVSHKSDKITRINFSHDAEDIDTLPECERIYNQVLETLIAKYGRPSYLLKFKQSSSEGFYRHYFCFGEHTSMFHNMDFFSPDMCAVETSIDQVSCVRAVFDYLEYGDNKDRFSLEVVDGEGRPDDSG